MKATAIIEGKHGRVELTFDTDRKFKKSETDIKCLESLAKKTREAYDKLKEGAGNGNAESNG